MKKKKINKNNKIKSNSFILNNNNSRIYNNNSRIYNIKAINSFDLND